MDLILWRHAEAVEPGPGMDDMSRVLTTQGERDAGRMAEWLDRHLPQDCRVLVSPALRTRQTVQDLRRPTRVVEDLAPRKGAQALLDVSGWPHAGHSVVVVGHQPTLGMVLAHVVGGVPLAQAIPWRLPKAGLWWIRCEHPRHDRPGVVVMAVRTPDLR